TSATAADQEIRTAKNTDAVKLTGPANVETETSGLAAAEATPPPSAATITLVETPAQAAAETAVEAMPSPAATVSGEETAAPAVAPIPVQEALAPIGPDDVKLAPPKPPSNGPPKSAELERLTGPAAAALSPAPAEKAAAKRAVAVRQPAARERASLAASRSGPHPSYGTGF